MGAMKEWTDWLKNDLGDWIEMIWEYKLPRVVKAAIIAACGTVYFLFVCVLFYADFLAGFIFFVFTFIGFFAYAVIH